MATSKANDGQRYERHLAATQPQTRRTHGVYYTPDYIVNYIVARTLGPWLRSKTPEAVRDELRVLDPACGAGAFLVGTYRYLVAWYRDQYTARPTAYRHRLEQDAAGIWRLTLAERQRILQTHLYGVDIDPTALDLARHALHTALDAGQPSLADSPPSALNLVYGNALLGPDFSGQDGTRLVDWRTCFPQTTKGQFNIILGNPPYVSFYSRESRKPSAKAGAYLAQRFASVVGGRGNNYLYFLALALELRHPDGYMGMIVPDTLLTNLSYARTRQALLSSGLMSVDRLDFPVFSGATVRNAIVVVGPRDSPPRLTSHATRDHFEAFEVSLGSAHLLSMAVNLTGPWPIVANSSQAICQKMIEQGIPLSQLAESRDGVNPGPRAFRARILNPTGPIQGTWRPVIEGRHVTPYFVLPTSEVIDYNPSLLTPDLKRKGASFRDPGIFAAPKLVSRQTADTLIFALDTEGVCALNSVHCTRALDGRTDTLLFLLGLLNSRLMRFFYRVRFQETRRVFPQVHIAALRTLPIPCNPNLDAQAAIVEQVEHLVLRHKGGDSKALVRYQTIIDNMVYRLYGLADEEIRVVEGGISIEL